MADENKKAIIKSEIIPITDEIGKINTQLEGLTYKANTIKAYGMLESYGVVRIEYEVQDREDGTYFILHTYEYRGEPIAKYIAGSSFLSLFYAFNISEKVEMKVHTNLGDKYLNLLFSINTDKPSLINISIDTSRLGKISIISSISLLEPITLQITSFNLLT